MLFVRGPFVTCLRPPIMARIDVARSLPAFACSAARMFSSTHPGRALTKEQTAIVKSTAPVMAEHGVEITTRFYKKLFTRHPELNNIFNAAHQSTGVQPAALAHAVWAYAANIDNLGALKEAVSRIGHKHASLGVTAEQYPIVGENLLWAVKDVLGDAATPKIIDAWAAAYHQLAEIFIKFEGDLYKEAAAVPGGWNGWRKFRVARKVTESDEIISFHLEPKDGGALPAFKPGQYISVRVFVPELGVYQPRQYSLSSTPNEKTFRISVKREFATASRPSGRISNVLHENLPAGSEMEVSYPYGDFTIDLDATTPVVLISGGVGLTPMISMLSAIVEQSKTRPVVFVHAARNSKVHAMKNYLADIMAQNKQVSKAIYYEEVSDKDVKGSDYDYVGRVDLSNLKDKTILPNADYYLCGPLPFMNAQKKCLLSLRVPEQKIHLEIFGSTVG